LYIWSLFPASSIVLIVVAVLFVSYYTLSSFHSLPVTVFLAVVSATANEHCYFAVDKNIPTSGNRSEFLAVDTLGSAADIQYGLTGGWFMSTKRALLLDLLVIIAMVLVGTLVQHLATCKGGKMVRLSRWVEILIKSLGEK
jgi:hypothetical protein